MDLLLKHDLYSIRCKCYKIKGKRAEASCQAGEAPVSRPLSVTS